MASVSIATATQSDGARRVRDWVQLIRRQFQQTPHLCVTAEQASRLWGLEAAELEAVLSAFVDAHLLNRTRGGAYSLRLDPGPLLKCRPSRRSSPAWQGWPGQA